ncbi:MAG: GGDEF domain-containing protein [Caulobacteraceae bacterium]
MKISGPSSEAFSAIRKRALAQAGANVTQGNLAVDRTGFLGLAETELTPAVQGAIRTLMTEIDDLRGEVSRLKSRLQEAEVLADQDGLTPALNRRALARELHRVAAFSRRYGSPASLVYFDLDAFKLVNDRFGHAAGDSALKAVAERLKALVRENDVVGRMGGDEFGVILVQSDADTAEVKAAALAEAIRREPVNFGDWSAPLHLTWGVRQIDPDADPEQIIADADAAMYARKRAKGLA